MRVQTSHDTFGKADGGSRPEGSSRGPAGDLSALQEGRRVLVVENDFMLADDLRRDLEREGADVMGPVASVAEALDLLRSEPSPDAAILDVFLDDEVSYSVADILRGRGIPFVFAINRLGWMIPQTYADVPRVEKPVDTRRLARALASCPASIEAQE